jgi:hypothetical protein
LGFVFHHPGGQGGHGFVQQGPSCWDRALADVPAVFLLLATAEALTVGPLLADLHHLACGIVIDHKLVLPAPSAQGLLPVIHLGCLPIDIIKGLVVWEVFLGPQPVVPDGLFIGLLID